jgi:flagellar hook protein FlgE
MGSFLTALSGLSADTTALDVVGNNLANMTTQGFKGDNILFEDAMNAASASLQVGGGVANTVTSTDFTQGTLEATGQPLDAAISGNGFFVVQDPTSGATEYTRDGSFSLNAQGQLVTSAGDLVQGWPATNGVVNASGATSAVTVPLLTPIPPVATQNVSLSANLDANAAVGDTFSAPIQVYDSVGNAQTLSVNFTNTGPGAWSYTVTLPSSAVTGGTGATTQLATGSIAFNSSGVLTTPAAGTPVSITNTLPLADGAATMKINWNLYDASGNSDLTGFAQSSATSGSTQDGSAPGTVTGVALSDGGNLVATYSNGVQQTLAQVALASVANPDSMIATTGNNFELGPSTMTPAIGASGTGGRGSVEGQKLEQSNVDMATQFTDLIVFQEGYDANSKVLTTVNQMEQTLLAINP